MTETLLPDAPARASIETDTGETLFVEAGAGSGKTTALVGRVVALVLSKGEPLSRIAAVTFTEKAGAELRDRLRAAFDARLQALQPVGQPAGEGDEEAERARQALADLDSAAIGTLHSFAQRILLMYPIQARLPPLIEVLDEVASSVAFEARWSAMQRRLLDDPRLADAVLLALSAGVKFDQLRSLARAFGNDWDLIDERVPSRPLVADLPDTAEVLARARSLAARVDECSDADDRFLPFLARFDAWARALGEARTDAERFVALTEAEKIRWGNTGRAANWQDLPGLKTQCSGLRDDVAALAAEFADATLRPLAHWIAGAVRESARERTEQGALEFHDLLVLARDLLRRDERVRAELSEAFPCLLLDEFQDSDPIQIEIAVRIAAGASGGATDWRDVRPPQGSLFVVGDPKQSIYRFRRASIATYLEAQRLIGRDVALTTNFRSVPAVLGWVNAVFAQVLGPPAVPTQGRAPSQSRQTQPTFRALDAHRPAPSGDHDQGPAVVVLGAQEHPDRPNADQLREREAADVAAVVRQALAEGWTVYDDVVEAWRPARAGDIAVLVPSRTSLPFLEEAFDAAGLPYRAESSSLVYQAAEVRDLMAAARALADPSDLLSCVTALRSPLFGCGDDDLWTYRRDGGSFSILAGDRNRPAGLAGHPVSAALDYLAQLCWASRWLTPSEVLATLAADRRMLEVAAVGPRARDQWRRLRFVIDQARAWSDVQHGGLREYLSWAARQADETSRVAEAVLPETDLDVVRVMTVHAAKGLEFGVTVLSGMSSRPQHHGGVRLLWTDRGYAVKVSKHMQTNDFQAVQPIDEQMDAEERRRLLYVAATRARDHLVVSLHRSGGAGTNARVLADAGAAEVDGVLAFAPAAAPGPPRPGERHQLPSAPDYRDWRAGVEAARARSRLRPATSASGLEGTEPEVALAVPAGDSGGATDEDDGAGLAKGARDLELPPWSKGRYGTAIGRAVHGVLQAVDLAAGDGTAPGLAAAVAGQALAEGVPEHHEVVAALCRSALASEPVRRAATRRHWRESYVGTQLEDGTVLEGYVDLLYQEDDGSLVIVDYKTDAVPVAALDRRVAYYAPQLRAYRRAVTDAVRPSGPTESAVTPQVRAVLLFLHPDPGVAAHVRVVDA